MALEWDDAYSVGEEEIDNQHKKLFEYIDKLDTMIEQGARDRAVRNFLDALGLYIQSHFCYEEICMRKYHCPVAERNLNEHHKLEDAYEKFRQRFEKEGYSDELLRELHAVAESWIVNHIMKIDVNLKPCIEDEQ